MSRHSALVLCAALAGSAAAAKTPTASGPFPGYAAAERAFKGALVPSEPTPLVRLKAPPRLTTLKGDPAQQKEVPRKDAALLKKRIALFAERD